MFDPNLGTVQSDLPTKSSRKGVQIRCHSISKTFLSKKKNRKKFDKSQRLRRNSRCWQGEDEWMFLEREQGTSKQQSILKFNLQGNRTTQVPSVYWVIPDLGLHIRPPIRSTRSSEPLRLGFDLQRRFYFFLSTKMFNGVQLTYSRDPFVSSKHLRRSWFMCQFLLKRSDQSKWYMWI